MPALSMLFSKKRRLAFDRQSLITIIFKCLLKNSAILFQFYISGTKLKEAEQTMYAWAELISSLFD